MKHLTETDVYDYARGICFKTGPPGLVGVEAEWFAADIDRPHVPVPIDILSTAAAEAGPPPAGSSLTFEPGGQVELSSPPCRGPAAAAEALGTDIDHLAKALDGAGVRLHGSGLDPERAPVRQLRSPRYDAMAAYFGRRGTAGRTMMCSTASLQVCLDIGAEPDDAARRWRAVHRLGPLFVAVFANSPMWRGRPTGWRSTRWAVWSAIDPSRTRPVRGTDPAADWARYALDAGVMATPGAAASESWGIDPGHCFAEWIAVGTPRKPTADDLEFHLSTLFPPVRPRGWLELRMIDALPAEWWPVPVAVAAALVDDPEAADVAERVAGGLFGPLGPAPADWLAAARSGPADPGVAAAARVCFAAAAEALPRMGSASLVPVVDAYRDRFVERGQCPADEALLKGAA
nr:ergothioneine biosynthesis glutamate--cysteine ligase EgtA [Murinocardiopsis flavida]